MIYGAKTYIEVYKPDQSKPNWYKSACASASRMLSNVKVMKRINELLADSGFNDAVVDKQLAFLITQFADFLSKLAAIKEYNRLKRRTTKSKEYKGNLIVKLVSYKTSNK